MKTLSLAERTAYYVLFFAHETSHRYPGVGKGTSFPIGMERPLQTPENRGVTFGQDELPDWLADKLWLTESWFDAEQLAQAYVDVPVRSDVLPHLPDVFMVKSVIVSARAKAVLQSYNPKIAYFHQARVVDANTGQPSTTQYWSCAPRRRILARVKRNWDAPDYTDSDGPTGKSLPALHWVPGALEYLANTYHLLEDWGGAFCMNHDLFDTLQRAGLTGLTEIPADAHLRIAERGEIYDPRTETVSHVFWNNSDLSQQ